MAKSKEEKPISGQEIVSMRSRLSWLSCLLKTGEKMTISFYMLFHIFDEIDFLTEKYGNHWRVIGYRIKGTDSIQYKIPKD